MPNFNGTGPLGRGPYTGWGRGPCGAGMAQGRGRGFGRFPSRWGYPSYQPEVNSEDEKGILEEELKGLESEMEEIKSRLKGFDKKK